MKNTLVTLVSKIIPTAFLLICAGCNTYQLEERWLPLEEIVERPDANGFSGISTTIGTRVYRANLDQWLEANPPGSIMFEELMYHEQVHSKRQLEMGLPRWLARYGQDTEFMLYEEQLGYYAGFMSLQRRGYPIVPEAIASVMSNYRNISGKMVSYDDALIWVRDALSGRWKPKDEDLWSLPDFLR
jgi:hypothetical protein